MHKLLTTALVVSTLALSAFSFAGHCMQNDEMQGVAKEQIKTTTDYIEESVENFANAQGYYLVIL